MRRLITALTLALATDQHSIASLCDGPPRPLAPSRDLYCIELICATPCRSFGRVDHWAPRPVQLMAGCSLLLSRRVTPKASPRPHRSPDRLTGVIATHVDHVSRLGEVRNGRAELPAIELDKFIILATAEPSANVTAPSGPFVLRGASPSTRLQPADLMQFTLGATREPDAHTMQHQHAAPTRGATHAPDDVRAAESQCARLWIAAPERRPLICRPPTQQRRARDHVS